MVKKNKIKGLIGKVRLPLDFKEIKSGSRFESLVAAYFESYIDLAQSAIFKVEVKRSGSGADGGVDILVDFQFTDAIAEFSRRWVIQCKFHRRDISPKAIADINIPSLIHSYKADGYLLICREKPTSKLTALFERLTSGCSLKYQYKIWQGDVFLSKLMVADNTIRQFFFPAYYEQETIINESTK